MERPARYTTRLLKGGALLPQMRVLVRVWKENFPPRQMLVEVEQRQILGNLSRRRVRDILERVFVPRYVRGRPPQAWRYLRPFEDVEAPLDVVRPLYYLYAARAEALMGDFVRDALYTWYAQGQRRVGVMDGLRFIARAETEKRIPEPWSESVRIGVAQHLLTALRDFGILEGRARKRIAVPYLPVMAFAHVAFLLSRERRGAAILEHPDWRLFLLSPNGVERLFLEADQAGLLRYRAAGSIVRLEFPTEDFDAYNRFLATRATQTSGR